MPYPRITLFCLHYLGGSARTFARMADRLPGHVRIIGIDLPGFGQATNLASCTVDAMADHVVDCIRAAAPPHWALLGHSMGAKVAMAVARRSEDGADGLSGLARLILVAGSPPAPEPMDDAKRREMLGWFGGSAEQSRQQATDYIRSNVAGRLPPAIEAFAVADVLQAQPPAWIAWLTLGSREDWSAAIGVLQTPTLVIVGARDPALGAATQTSLTLPHLAHARLAAIEGAAHLPPLECPTALASLVHAHLASADPPLPLGPPVDPAYLALIGSDRVSHRLRTALLDRAIPDDPGYCPSSMSVELFGTLRAVLARVLPQQARAIDLAARIDRRLATGQGDGWRFADLPADRDAYATALDGLNSAAQTMAGMDFAALDPDRQDRLLQQAGNGERHAAEQALPAAAVQMWFQDLCAEAARHYVAHPATLARMGYGGIGCGGAADTMAGFDALGIGQREAWEPAALADR